MRSVLLLVFCGGCAATAGTAVKMTTGDGALSCVDELGERANVFLGPFPSAAVFVVEVCGDDGSGFACEPAHYEQTRDGVLEVACYASDLARYTWIAPL
jgi:hypothetical protein